ncbi:MULTISPECIES: polysaccharide biosynthesis tyrosine autokinase [unclassified Blastococcus]
MELREVAASLRAAWWLPVLGALLGAGGALLASLVQTPLYTSNTQLFVSTRDSFSSSDAVEGAYFSQARVTSYARLIMGPEMRQRVTDRLGEGVGDGSTISAIASTETVLIDVSVTDASPAEAQQVAEAIGQEFTIFVGELEAPEGEGLAPVQVRVTEEPQVPSAASSPQTDRNVTLGLLGGAVLGAGGALLRSRLDRSVKNSEELADLVAAPVIGTVLRDEAVEKVHTIEHASGRRTVEDYRQIRTNLQFLDVDSPPKVIMMSSALPSEGKTTLVVNLAIALAEAGQRVTVIEADLRRPKVTRYLGMVGGVGLTNVLAGSADLEDVLQTYRDGMSVVAAGPTPPNPGELLASSHMANLVTRLRAQNDFVLVDAPPLLPVADATGLATSMDGVLLAVRHGSTHRDQVRQAVANLDRVGARILGVILNVVPPKAHGASVYGYSYGYESTEPEKSQSALRHRPPAA